MKPIKWEYTVTLLLVSVSILIVILMAVGFIYGQQYRSQLLEDLKNVKSTGFIMETIPNYTFNTHTQADYHEMVERPLFFKDRRPVEPKEIEAVAVSNRPKGKINSVLIGIINTPNGNYCLFQDPKAKEPENKFLRFKQGDEINGWRIKEIKSDRVVITSASGAFEDILLAKPRAVKRTINRRTRASTKKNPFKRKTKK